MNTQAASTRQAASTSNETVSRTHVKRLSARALLSGRYSAIYLAIVFIVLYSFLIPDAFPTSVNFQLVATSGVITCTLALAFLIPLTANQYDLSIGGVMAMSLVMMNWMTLHTGLPLWLITVVTLAICVGFGILTGALVVLLSINSFIATLGISTLLSSLVLVVSQNKGMYGEFGKTATDLGNRTIVGIPILVVYLAVLALVVWFVIEQTSYGRRLFATGGNESATRLAGVQTSRVIWTSLVLSAGISGLAGVFFALQTGSFATSVGPGYLFPAVAAVFLGASQFRGRPSVLGTLVAYYALAIGLNGLNLKFAEKSYWIDPLFQSIALIFAVALARRKFWKLHWVRKPRGS